MKPIPSRTAWASVLFVLASIISAANASAASTVHPFFDCIDPRPAGYSGQVLYGMGYDNQSVSTVTHPVGPDNYFSPSPSGRGQPESFEPGMHHNVFFVTQDLSVATHPFPLIWTVGGTGDGNTATSDQFHLPQCQGEGLAWQDEWQATPRYWRGDIVRHDGSAWIATQSTVGVEPDGGAAEWNLLAARGATGAAGPQGVTGPRGPAGPPGPPGPGTSVGKGHHFNARGRTRVRDRRVKRTSFVMVQYYDRSRRFRNPRRPTNVIATGKGYFVARGQPRARFRYAVVNPG